MNKILLTFILFFLFNDLCLADARDLFGVDKVDPDFQGGSNDFITTVDNIAGYLIGLFYFIAVMLAIYGGFTILTSMGEEEKMKKGKNIIIYVVIGLVVIFLASQIVNWVISTLSDPGVVGQ